MSEFPDLAAIRAHIAARRRDSTVADREAPQAGQTRVAIAQRVGDLDEVAPYEVHGYEECIICRSFCYLNGDMQAATEARTAFIACSDCAKAGRLTVKREDQEN